MVNSKLLLKRAVYSLLKKLKQICEYRRKYVNKIIIFTPINGQ